MAIVQFPGGLVVPPPLAFSATAPSSTATTIDAAGEKTSVVFTVPKTGTLERFEFKVATVTLNAASRIKVSFQDLDASRNPDGTADQYRVLEPADLPSNSWIAPDALTDDGTDTGNKRSVTRGQRIACVIEYDTFTVADSFQVTHIGGSSTANWTNPSYRIDYDGASWSKTDGAIVTLALRYDDGTYTQIIGAYPVSNLSNAIFNSGSAVDERGMLFQLPAPMLVGGIIARIAPSDANMSIPIVLYDTDGQTVLRTSNLVGFANTNSRHLNLRFDSDVRLEANVPYRLTVKPSSATNVTLYYFETESSELMEMMEGGANWGYCERVNDGDWTDTTNKRPWMSLWVTGIDHDISGGSGGPGSGGIE